MMPRKKVRSKVRSKDDRTMPMVHPNQAAIDVGSTLLMAAVRSAVSELSRPICIGWQFGLQNAASRPSRWNRPASTGFRSTSFSTPAALLCSLSMPAMRSTCPGARPTSAMRSGCSGFILTVCCAPAFGPKVISSSCAVRQRERPLEYAASHIQHMQKALTEMNL
jgi:transposase